MTLEASPQKKRRFEFEAELLLVTVVQFDRPFETTQAEAESLLNSKFWSTIRGVVPD
jgi:hypothetical protein